MNHLPGPSDEAAAFKVETGKPQIDAAGAADDKRIRGGAVGAGDNKRMKAGLFIHPADNGRVESGNGSRVGLHFPENQSAAPMMSLPERRYCRKVATVSVSVVKMEDLELRRVRTEVLVPVAGEQMEKKKEFCFPNLDQSS